MAISLLYIVVIEQQLPHHLTTEKFLEALGVRAIPFPEQVFLLQHRLVPVRRKPYI